tara:strand:- start:113 stop:373 length:261 start_codon:yes stop_codon:yes gene_type:complete
LTSYNASRKSVSELLNAEKGHNIPWSKTLKTIDGERVCVLDVEAGVDDVYTVLCLVDFGNEVGSDWYTPEGEYTIGVPSGNSLIPI